MNTYHLKETLLQENVYVSVYKILVTQRSGYWYTENEQIYYHLITDKEIDVQWNWVNFPK